MPMNLDTYYIISHINTANHINRIMADNSISEEKKLEILQIIIDENRKYQQKMFGMDLWIAMAPVIAFIVVAVIFIVCMILGVM